MDKFSVGHNVIAETLNKKTAKYGSPHISSFRLTEVIAMVAQLLHFAKIIYELHFIGVCCICVVNQIQAAC